MPHVLGTLEVYEQQTAYPVVVDNTEVLVFWGGEPSTQPDRLRRARPCGLWLGSRR